MTSAINRLSWLQHEDLHLLNEHFLKHVKLEAKRERKASSLTHLQALDKVSRSFSFQSWKHLQSTYKYETETGTISTLKPGTHAHLFDCYTERQLHGAVYRFLDHKPHDQIVQITFEEADYQHAWMTVFGNEKEALNQLLKIGLVEDLQLTHWLIHNDPYFEEPGCEPAAFRFLYPTPLTHSQALVVIGEAMGDLGLTQFGCSCWPQLAWINGSLPSDTTPPLIEEGIEDCPVLVLPIEIHQRIYE